MNATPVILSLSLLAVSSVGHAEARWGTFRDLGCIDPVRRPGLRVQAAVLWGAADAQGCAAKPAAFPGAFLAHPAVCIGAGYSDTVLVDAAAFAASAGCADDSCSPPRYQGPARAVWEVSGEIAAALGDPPAAQWEGRAAQAIDAVPARVHAPSAAPVTVWGVFVVPDAACLLAPIGQG